MKSDLFSCLRKECKRVRKERESERRIDGEEEGNLLFLTHRKENSSISSRGRETHASGRLKWKTGNPWGSIKRRVDWNRNIWGRRSQDRHSVSSSASSFDASVETRRRDASQTLIPDVFNCFFSCDSVSLSLEFCFLPFLLLRVFPFFALQLLFRLTLLLTLLVSLHIRKSPLFSASACLVDSICSKSLSKNEACSETHTKRRRRIGRQRDRLINK